MISISSISCGQATLKDDGLDSKSAEENSIITSGGSSNSSFTFSSVSHADGATLVNKTGATITFGDDVNLKKTDVSSISVWTTSSTLEGSCSDSYGSKYVHIARDNFTNCHPENGSVSGITITLSLKGKLASLGNHKVKIRKTYLDGFASTQYTLGVQIPSEYNSFFTASN